ncbi:MAG: glycosyltransferase family 4 protein [Clostridium sp.]
MKKVFFIHNTIASYRIEFFEKLCKKMDVEFLITKPQLSQQIYGDNLNDDKLKNIKFRNVSNKFNIAFGLNQILNDEEFDTAVIPSMDNFSEFADAFIAYRILKKRNKRVVYFTEKWKSDKNNSLSKKIKNKIRETITRPILKNVDTIICSGSKSKEYMTDVIGVDEKKCEIVYDASSSESSSFENNDKNSYNGKKVVLYYGRIVKRKGLDDLIKSFEQIKKRENSVLLICGDGEFKGECEKLVEDNNIKDVEFLGKIAPEDRLKYFSLADVFVLPSVNLDGTIEAWGLTVNEAMDAGIPVVASDVVGAAYDMIKDGLNGYMYKGGDVNGLAESILNVIKDDCRLDNMKIAAKKTVVDDFNFDSMTKGFVNILNR